MVDVLGVVYQYRQQVESGVGKVLVKCGNYVAADELLTCYMIG